MYGDGIGDRQCAGHAAASITAVISRANATSRSDPIRSDPTKKAMFSLSGIKSGTTRTFTLSNTSAELRGHPDLNRQQDLFGDADRLGHGHGLGGLGQHRHGNNDCHLRDGHLGDDDQRDKDREPRHRRRIQIDHGRQHRLGQEGPRAPRS